MEELEGDPEGADWRRAPAPLHGAMLAQDRWDRGQGKWGEEPRPAFPHKKGEAELCTTISRKASGAVESTLRVAANQEQLNVSSGMQRSPEGLSPAPPPTMDPASSDN